MILIRILFYTGAILALMGCSTIRQVLVNSCEIPAALDYRAEGPVAIPEGQMLPLKDFLKVEAGERHLHKVLADDYNDLADHVRTSCK